MATFLPGAGASAGNGKKPVADPPAQTAPIREVSRATWIGRGALALALVPLGAFYLGPRIVELTVTPGHLHQVVEAGERYNPALERIVAHERVTVRAFAVLDQIRQCVAGVQEMGTAVTTELNTLVDQISGDVQAILDRAGANVTDLVASLDALTTHVGALRDPASGAAAALAGNRETMSAILDEMRVTADEVRNTRISAKSAAGDLSGR